MVNSTVQATSLMQRRTTTGTVMINDLTRAPESNDQRINARNRKKVHKTTSTIEHLVCIHTSAQANQWRPRERSDPTHPVLVDDVDDNDEAAILLAVVHKGHSPDLHEPLERLQNHDINKVRIN